MSVNRKILRLALPSIVSNITVPLLGLADVAIVGHIGDEQYISAIAIGSMIFNIAYWLFGFLRMGTSGMTSQALGRKDFSEILFVLNRALQVAFLVALCILVFQYPIRLLAFWLMGTPTEIIALVTTYFSIVVWGAPAMLGLYALTGWFVGMQNTKAPMIVAIIQNVVNIAMSAFLVFVQGMRIEGVALGTLFAQWTGFVIALIIFQRYYRRLSVYLSGNSVMFFVKASFKEWIKFFRVNRDIFLRTLCLVAVNLFFTSFGARQGTMILAVNTLLMTLFTLFSYVMDGFAYAGEALAGRYYGAKNWGMFHQTVHGLFQWGLFMTILFCSTYFIGGQHFLSLLTDKVSVTQAASPYFIWAVMIPLTGMAAFIYDGVFIGITETRGMLVSSFVASVCFFVLFLLLHPVLHNHALWLALNCYLAARGVIQYLIFHRRFCKE